MISHSVADRSTGSLSSRGLGFMNTFPCLVNQLHKPDWAIFKIEVETQVAVMTCVNLMKTKQSWSI